MKVITNTHKNLSASYHNQDGTIIATKEVDDFKRRSPHNDPQKVGTHTEHLCEFSHSVFKQQKDGLSKKLWLLEDMFTLSN